MRAFSCRRLPFVYFVRVITRLIRLCALRAPRFGFLRNSQKASLREFERSISDEQRGWLCRVREQGREAIEVARRIMAGHVAELVHQRQYQEGARQPVVAGIVDARDRKSSRDGSSRGDDELALRGGMDEDNHGDKLRYSGAEKCSGRESRLPPFETEQEGVESGGRGTTIVESMGVGEPDDGHSAQVVHGDRMGFHGTGSQEHQGWGNRQTADEDNQEAHDHEHTIVHLQTQAEVLTAFAAAEASCLSSVSTWVEDARRRARDMTSSWKQEVASSDHRERAITTAELEALALALAFHASKKEADEAFGARCDDLLSRPSDAAGGGAAVRAGEATWSRNSALPAGPQAEAAKKVELVPCGYIAEERKECSALWSSFDPLLSSLRVEFIPTGNEGSAGNCYAEEEEEEASQVASQIIDGLESQLKGEVASFFARKVEEVRPMIRAGIEEHERLACGLPGKQQKKERALPVGSDAPASERRETVRR